MYVLLTSTTLVAVTPRLGAQAQGTDAPRSCASPRPTPPPATPPGTPPTKVVCLARVEVLAEGNIKDVLGGAKNATAAAGTLGMQYVGNRNVATGMVNIAGTDDTVQTSHAATLLVPAAGKGLNAAMLSIRTRFRSWENAGCSAESGITCNMGIRFHTDASTRRWATKSARLAGSGGTDSVTQITQTMDVPSWGGGLGLWYAFFDGAITNNDGASRAVTMVLDVGITHRALRGDLGGERVAMKALRDSLLGDSRTNFTGAEVGLTLQFDRIRSTFTYYRLNGHADGLSRGQIVGTVELRAPLASGLLDRK
jgi:hypothetical protein